MNYKKLADINEKMAPGSEGSEQPNTLDNKLVDEILTLLSKAFVKIPKTPKFAELKLKVDEAANVANNLYASIWGDLYTKD